MSQTQITSKVEIRDQTKLLVKQWLDEAVSDAARLDPSYAHLWEAISRQFTSGGKWIRPVLTVVSYESFGGHNPAIYNLAAAQELLHVSLLIHDDIMDHDYMRHGQPNVAGEYLEYYRNQPAADHRAMSAALLAGDLLQARGHQAIAFSGFDADIRQAAAKVFARQLYEVAAGQLLDVEAEMHDQTPELYLKVNQLKTATYSFTGPLLMGAEAAGAPQSAFAELEELGNSLGVAFQLADDLLGMFGDQAKIGKPILSDMREGKLTYTIRQALLEATAEDKAWLVANWGRPDVTIDDLVRTRSIVQSSGSQVKTMKMMESYVDRATAALERLALPPASHQLLAEIIDQSVWRSV